MLDFAGRPKGRFIMRGVVGIFILEMALINIQGGNAAGMVSGGGIDSTRRDWPAIAIGQAIHGIIMIFVFKYNNGNIIIVKCTKNLQSLTIF